MLLKKWNLLKNYDISVPVADQLLENRGIIGEVETEKFLNPPKSLNLIQILDDDFKESLERSKKIILDAINEKLTIVVYGDYDADGVCATAILYKTISGKMRYENCSYFIPNRFEHGYGLSNKSINEAVTKAGSHNKKILFITVDSGITAVEETDYIKSLGHSIIITDHHQKPGILPNANNILWTDNLVGSGISYILSCYLGYCDDHLLSLAAIATVTDLQPVLGLNRSIVKDGLEVLNSDPPVSIKTLLQLSGKNITEVTTYDLGWIIGPRLNSSGRIVDAEDSLKLLLSDSEEEAQKYALKLNNVNSERQDKTIEMYGVAATYEKTNVPKLILSSSEEYHEGIIGLVAAKLVQKYYRPSIVVSLGEEYGKGSVRSIPGVDIISALRKHSHMFESLGGHPMAAGFTILRSKLEEVHSLLLAEMEEMITGDLLTPSIDIDLKISLNMVNPEFVREVSSLKPFGMGNPEPLFLSENVGISNMNIVGRDRQHLSFRLFDGSNYLKGIFFGGAGYADSLNIGDRINVVYSLKESEFNGSKYIELIIKDLRKNSDLDY
ncbi:single-stranded-DNA-specific exonuclease RecJ [candidate division WWE3 bacterium RIFCSPLOWO2_01_FULL_37_15]|uniref:Single-stranded-DNA-specific exonuclease RecJ n=1 Tax=candidate division WWE3 bacterium RIFCSPLOWO2_01_FULL_37_15 TaxID=1802622 RepID=A0A1F4UX78_UNCKA|nr:MAG: single-stranded-DNA-specific exonuclease RecJ [candidate division WWE3 bacterium RIFCSPLOWO2_01_FULL_37_15]